MYLNRKNQLVYAAFPHLAALPGAIHGIFTRSSEKPALESAEVNVDKNPGNSGRQAVEACMSGLELVFLNQVHGKRVTVIRDADDLAETRQTPPTADAVITRIPGAGLTIQAADCQAVMLFDPVRRAAANIHSGWRGSIADIIGECVHAMKQEFGTDPADLAAGIGPSLGPCCAEFIHYQQEIPERFWQYRDEKDRFDFWQISRDQLRAAGVQPENVACAGMCTRCNPHLFFSYRREGKTGRFAAVIGVDKELS